MRTEVESRQVAEKVATIQTERKRKCGVKEKLRSDNNQVANGQIQNEGDESLREQSRQKREIILISLKLVKSHTSCWRLIGFCLPRFPKMKKGERTKELKIDAK